ncbi:MAG: hypothetical protein AVDCRST_MAG37-3585 [uncultured Rubrobacteraceae bacterium]|uniref:Uncharacterized protein n=1 Tax=uncultured Rubrobacteraceae bacterium TaxID=349277 RepID=A0A6J4R4E4_9ACTN|nr:MAG: hypothetical protein AVDCRST_MAG37-3585 [uncultured Rubrobacteraceae bacterium]
MVRLTDNWIEALRNPRVLGGEIEASNLARKRHRIQREAFRNPHRDQVRRHPANAGGDDWMTELQKLPSAPDPWDPYPLVGKRVDTLRGPGLLWQVIVGEARIVFDSDTSCWVSLNPSELALGDAA